MHRFSRTILVAIVSLTAGACAGAGRVHIVPRLLQSNTISIVNQPSVPMPTVDTLLVNDIAIDDLVIPPIAQAPPELADSNCDILSKIDELEVQLASVSLSVGAKKYRYTEIRNHAAKVFNEPETQIALGLLEQNTCATRTVVVTKRGNQLLVPSGYDIEVVCQRNGICWNYWNTSYRVNGPAGWFVVADEYPYTVKEPVPSFLRAASGKLIRRTKIVDRVARAFYSPYSQQLHTSEMIAAGPAYQQQLSQKVSERLRVSGVRSRAFPEMPLVNVPALKPEYAERKMPIEYMDQYSFNQDPEATTDWVHILIGANRDHFGIYTCSPKKACGPRQFIKSTWQLMVSNYPAVGLDKYYERGARNPEESMVAARLLDDYNLSVLKNGLTPSQFTTLIDNPRLLEEVLAALYNAGPKRVVPVITAYLKDTQKWADWTDAHGHGRKDHLVSETKGYVLKLRYVRDEWSAIKSSMALLSPNR